MLLHIISFNSHSNMIGKVPCRYFLQIGPNLKSLRYKRRVTHGKMTQKMTEKKGTEHEDRCSISLAHQSSGKCKLNPQGDTIRIVIKLRTHNTSVCEDEDKLEHSHLAGGNINGIATVEHSLAVSYKVRHTHTFHMPQQFHSSASTREQLKYAHIKSVCECSQQHYL